MRSITILGSTGSIGRQALELVRLYPQEFRVEALCARRNAEQLFEQVKTFRPRFAALTEAEVEIPDELKQGCEWLFGSRALEQMARFAPAEDVLVAVSGMVGLRAVIAAREAGRRVLLANKEALVAGGSLVMDHCAVGGLDASLLPVDSEHSAIFQCLNAAEGNPYRKIILTASGGPFRNWPIEKIMTASPQQALEHPNWSMGPKITVDSASMFNKALEIIEAKWLFEARPDQIEVLVHPQSIVHSLVEFEDNAVLAQLGLPDMKLPILYAMSYPRRLPVSGGALNLASSGQLSFEQPDTERFPAIRLAYDSLRAGGAAACVLNAANEKAVELFLKEKISFGHIYRIVDETMQRLGAKSAVTLEEVEDADSEARRIAESLSSRSFHSL